MHKIYIRKLRFSEAKDKFLKEIESCFAKGIDIVEVIHGIGTYTLRNMVIEEVKNLDYVDFLHEPEITFNPGSIKLVIQIPDKSRLNQYLSQE